MQLYNVFLKKCTTLTMVNRFAPEKNNQNVVEQCSSMLFNLFCHRGTPDILSRLSLNPINKNLKDTNYLKENQVFHYWMNK